MCKVHFAVSKLAAFYDDPTMDFSGNFMILSIDVYLTGDITFITCIILVC